MPSVQYNPAPLVTSEAGAEKHPFEVRVSKWFERSGNYHVRGFVEVTDFGQELAAQSDPYAWVTNTYQTADNVTKNVVSEWVDGVSAVQAGKLTEILQFCAVDTVDKTVTDGREWRMEFEVVLSGATTFDINWLAVDFDPTRGDT